MTVSRPLSQAIVVCGVTLGLTASDPSDYNGLAQRVYFGLMAGWPVAVAALLSRPTPTV